jgi:hypothetical protein
MSDIHLIYAGHTILYGFQMGGLPFNLKFEFKLAAAQHAILRNLPNKLVHFLLDYHPDWLAHLQLPASALNQQKFLSNLRQSVYCYLAYLGN